MILGGVKRVQNARDVKQRSDVRAVVAVAQLRGEACLHHQVAAGTRGQSIHDRGAVPIVQYERVLAGHQTGRLKLGNPVQAFLVELDREAACEQRSRLGQLGGLGIAQRTNRGQVALQAGAVQSGLVQLLRGAHECARPSAHGAHQRLEVPAGFRREEHQHLLRTLRHRDRHALDRAFTGPRFAGEEPALRRRIGRSAQKRRDQQVMRGLRGGQVRLDPDAVADRQVRNLRGRQGARAPGDLDLEHGTGQVERRGAGTGCRGQNGHCQQQQNGARVHVNPAILPNRG